MKGKLLSREGKASSSRMNRVRLASSKRQEKQAAKRSHGVRTSGSGNTWHSKGDVRAPTRLIECKRTDKKQFILTLQMLTQIRIQALKAGKSPVLQLEFGTAQANQWTIIPTSEYERLHDESGEEDTSVGAPGQSDR
jgi:hypothetical protein